MAEMLEDDRRVLLPSLRRLEVQIRFQASMSQYRPVKASYRTRPVWKRLEAACQQRGIDVVIVEPPFLLSD